MTPRGKKWTDGQMKAAMKSVIDDNLSANRAADLHGVPRSSLKDRLSGRVKHGTKPGPKPYLTVDEEGELSQHLLQASAMRLGKTRRDVKCLVEVCVRKKGTLRDSTISNGWWDSFRYPKILQYAGIENHVRKYIIKKSRKFFPASFERKNYSCSPPIGLAYEPKPYCSGCQIWLAMRYNTLSDLSVSRFFYPRTGA